VTLNMVGFTLTGQAAKTQLSALAGSTGGRYFTAANGNELANAIRLAALPRCHSASRCVRARVVLSGKLGARPRAPRTILGIRITAPGAEDKLTIAPNHLTMVTFAYEGDKLVVRK
jgi:hypothetical protein